MDLHRRFALASNPRSRRVMFLHVKSLELLLLLLLLLRLGLLFWLLCESRSFDGCLEQRISPGSQLADG